MRREEQELPAGTRGALDTEMIWDFLMLLHDLLVERYYELISGKHVPNPELDTAIFNRREKWGHAELLAQYWLRADTEEERDRATPRYRSFQRTETIEALACLERLFPLIETAFLAMRCEDGVTYELPAALFIDVERDPRVRR
jgi:hypothetical protein